MRFWFLYSSESMPTRMDCPRCGSPDRRHSNSVRFLDAFWRAFGYTPYRCRSCRTRYFRRVPQKEPDLKQRTPHQQAGLVRPAT